LLSRRERVVLVRPGGGRRCELRGVIGASNVTCITARNG
jgi:hypothetical protein